MLECDKVKYFEICHFRLDYNLKEVATGAIATERATAWTVAKETKQAFDALSSRRAGMTEKIDTHAT